MDRYGQHTMWDIKLKPGQLMSKETASKLLLDLLIVGDLIPIGQMHYDMYSGDKDWDGPSFTIHVQTSHITAHFFEKGYMFLDMFSCKPFSPAAVQTVLKKYLKIDSIKMHDVVRGKDFPW